MKRIAVTALLTMLLVLGLSAIALAADSAVQVEGMKLFVATVTAAGFGIGLAASACGIRPGYRRQGRGGEHRPQPRGFR